MMLPVSSNPEVCSLFYEITSKVVSMYAFFIMTTKNLRLSLCTYYFKIVLSSLFDSVLMYKGSPVHIALAYIVFLFISAKVCF
jgi:hypothetical protein